MRQNIGGQSPWEHVAGTTATVNGEVACVGDAYGQAKVALENIREALTRAGARLEDVTRSRLHVTGITRWEGVGRTHGEMFGQLRPAATMVQVAALIDPRQRVEIAAGAVLP